MKTKSLCLYLSLLILFALLPSAAMAADSKFVKVDRADMVNGKYLVVAHDETEGEIAMGKTMDTSINALNSLPVTVVDDTITLSDADDFIWTVEVYEDGKAVRFVDDQGRYLALLVMGSYTILQYGPENAATYWTYSDTEKLSIYVDTTELRGTNYLNYLHDDDVHIFIAYFDLYGSQGKSFTFYKLVNSMPSTEEEETIPPKTDDSSPDAITGATITTKTMSLTKEEENRSPKTGDSSLPVRFWLGLGLTSAAGAVILLRRRKYS